MKLVPHRRPSDYLQPPLPPARVARMWREVKRQELAQQNTPQRRRWAITGLLAAALVAVLLRTRARPLDDRASLAGVVLDATRAAQSMRLPDGSSLSLGEGALLQVVAASDAETRLRLDRGRVVFDVTHQLTRRFVVEAGLEEVEVKGTRFDVEVSPRQGEPAAVTVRVERGSVELHDRDRALLSVLRHGEAWSSSWSPPDTPGPSEPPAPPPASASSAPVGVPAATAPLTARALFERADGARLAGRHAEAAAEFDRLVRWFPADTRAPLAAYELGRIRLGNLHEPRGALDAFAWAADHGAGEDAEVGRVEAAAQLSDRTECKRLQRAFALRYPASHQSARVARLCADP